MATPTPRPAIEALDIPAEQVAAEAKRLRQKAGELAEQRHQYLDLDADSACCPQGFDCPACPPSRRFYARKDDAR